jgi:cobalt/nickel transport protein
MEKKHVAMILAALIILAVPLLIFNGKGEGKSYFGGSDDQASQTVEATGYTPWLTSLWEPPSSEIESLLFSLQAAIGALIIGYFLGYYSGKRKTKKNDEDY